MRVPDLHHHHVIWHPDFSETGKHMHDMMSDRNFWTIIVFLLMFAAFLAFIWSLEG